MTIGRKIKCPIWMHIRYRKRRIPTSELNKSMGDAIEQFPPPTVKGKYIRIKYVTQLPNKTPCFAFFCNLPQYVKEPYKRYLENSIPFQNALPYCLSRVTPSISSTMALRVSVNLLKSVDFPTFGRPTMATIFPTKIIFRICILRSSRNCSQLPHAEALMILYIQQPSYVRDDAGILQDHS
ncbi:GTPase Der [subsurface metagenome]